MSVSGHIHSVKWTEVARAEYRLLIDESELMGNSVRIGLITRIFGTDPTVTGLMVPREKWEEMKNSLVATPEEK